ncbi:MAG: LytTR family DNA-binding domain-containing protein [Clostridiales bacterium]|nr:LytTR family DNA-binding domain-containing protein [Clostridiales bacterium]MCF8021216.1 LytTR family DNA-binding domain-containing protein [Clostridiales bacterium]
MRIVIAEDNPAEMDYLKKLLLQHENVKILGEAADGEKALDMIYRLKPEAAFLDISMPGTSGMALAQKVPEDVLVIFVTAHNQYALEAFDAGSVDYLLKPVTGERLKQSLDRVNRLLNRKRGSEKIFVKINGTVVGIDTDKIIFLEKVPFRKKLTIYTIDKQYTLSGNLNDFEEKLKDYGFARSHRSFVVNIHKISKLVPWENKTYLAVMEDTQKEVLVSRKYAPVIKNLLFD